MVNRLAGATSPYLEQHKDNPVEWWQWSAQAFDEARRRDVPVLISVGYAACHWCHVMAHESFADDEVAAAVNAAVVPIKVDREERPDIDAIYMAATQAMTGQGGWPMTVFATPDGQPFFCGTYFPREEFLRLVRAVSKAWREQREAVLRQGAAVVEAVDQSQRLGQAAGEQVLTPALMDRAATSLHRSHDDAYGGFASPGSGGQHGGPKFPPHLAMLFLLRHYQRTGDERCLRVVRHTATAMARGGIYDQLAGGFARYSVDRHWIVPHFEKMLYDNALLLRVYTQLWRLTGDPMAQRVATETAEFLVRDLLADAFVSSLDADTDGREGVTYVWTPAQLRDALGDEDGAWAAELLGATEAGTFEHGTSVLRLTRDIDDAEPDVKRRWARIRQCLLRVRAQRPQPSRDDKVVAAWNGLAIVALAEYAQVVEAAAALLPATGPTPQLADVANRAVSAATRAAELLADRHMAHGRLRRASRAGVVGEPAGVLDDYGSVAEAFCALHQLSGRGRWLELAGVLLDAAIAHFGDGRGGFYDTADDAERLVARPSDPTDNATPSGLSAIAAALVTYTALTGVTRYRDAAERALETVAPIMGQQPRFAGYACATAEALLSGPYEIAIATRDPRGEPLATTARRLAPPGAVIVVGTPDAAGVPLLASRTMLDERPTAYVCRGFVCDRPVTAVEDLALLLAAA